MRCRFCQHGLSHLFVDLAAAPPSNSFLTLEQLDLPEVYYPLKLYVCDKCWLVQVDAYQDAHEIFSGDYAYFSSYSKSWLSHAKEYASMAVKRFNLDSSSRVVEIASNDGYLLQYFMDKAIPCLGIEPTACTAEVARKKGIGVVEDFFGRELAEKLVNQGQGADLLIGNNVLAHVPDIRDFVEGLKIMLNPGGVITMEFPHLMQLVAQSQFDTIYHEHFSYFSLHTVQEIFQAAALTIFEVEMLSTHGGSLRIFARHAGDSADSAVAPDISSLLQRESASGMTSLGYYSGFQEKVDGTKNEFLSFLISQKQNNKTVVGYGAAAKGNTLLNYCGVKKDLIQFVADASPYKQGRFLPGSRIPVVSENRIKALRPDFVCIFPWNLTSEITRQLAYIRRWGGKFLTAVPALDCF